MKKRILTAAFLSLFVLAASFNPGITYAAESAAAHLKEGIDLIKQGIEHLEKGIKAGADEHAKEAIEHAKEALKHAETSLANAEEKGSMKK